MSIDVHRFRLFILFILLAILAGCNLGAGPAQPVDITNAPTNTIAPTRTSLSNVIPPTSVTITPFTFPTQNIQQIPISTSVVILPPVSLPPTNTPTPISILVLSPTPGSIVSRNIQILGSAIHPEFLQYRVEFGPDPNPNNLWFPITGIVQTPVLNGILGIWNTTTPSSPDGFYQLRLRLILRDGREQATVVNNIRVQNQAPTPFPTNTTVPLPIAAFTQDIATGDAPLAVRFTNLSQGTITSFNWSFGDGGSSVEKNPTYTFTKPGLYNVLLTVTGPGGSANVSRQFNVKSPTAPVAAFTVNTSSGSAPLTVNFTNQSTGNFTTVNWTFGDGKNSTERSPSYIFNVVGTYNVILDVTGPGGTSTAIRQITVEDPQIPEPKAIFTPTTTSGEVPLAVTFNNTSEGQITSFLWDFNGDGITDSVDKVPTHIYTTAGTFNARLTVIGPGGQSTAEATITAALPPNAPEANFTAAPLVGDAPLTVNFTNTTTGDVTAYVWDLNGDTGADSADKDPTYTYDQPGTYIVTLIATGPGGSTSKQGSITVTNPIAPPVANFLADPLTGDAPLTVNFTNQSEGSQLTYEWDFETDGVIDQTDPGPHTMTYVTPGTYTVSLSVSNPSGGDTATMQIVVNAPPPPEPPVAGFTVDTALGEAPLAVTFTDTSTGTITDYSWDFDGDGTADTTGAGPFTFNFNTPGTYNAALTVSGPGGSNSFSQAITVNAPPAQAPTANFTVDTASGDAPLTVTFTDASSGDITSYDWDFDGDSAIDTTGAGPFTFTYSSPGTFNAILNVTGPGGSNSFSVIITVNPPPAVPPVANFTVDQNTGDAPLTVTFTNASSGDITSYDWDFESDGAIDASGVGPFTFTYSNPGAFNATLNVTGPGGSNSFSVPITVNAPPAVPPVANFTVDQNTGDAPLTVTFTNASSGDITSYDWDFESDGAIDASGVGPFTFTYSTPGAFNAALNVTGPGGSNSFSVPITVNPPPAVPPVANFTVDTAFGDAPLTVTFTNASSGDITSYDWDFEGDGFVDNNGIGPITFTYNAPGLFNATLNVTGPGGSNSFSVAITVNPPAAVPPVANFTVDTAFGDAPLTVTFTNASSGDITSYQWDFNGDSVPDSVDFAPTFTYNSAGSFNATLTVTGPGGSNSFSQSITVNTPAVTPPSGDIVFVTDRDGNNEVYLMGLDGSNPVNVTSHPANDRQAVWSPDGSKIAFVTDRDGNDEIYVIDLNTLAVTNLTNEGNADVNPAWSADGSKIAFVSNRFGDNDIFIMNADGSSPVQLSSATANEVNPAWSPDNLQMVYVSDESGNNEIYVANVSDGSLAATLTADGANDRQPAWSPDGTTVAFVSDRTGDNEIFVMSAFDGSGLTQLTFDGANDRLPTWSPDSTQIYFVSDRDNGQNHIFVMNADGSGLTQLTFGGSSNVSPLRKP